MATDAFPTRQERKWARTSAHAYRGRIAYVTFERSLFSNQLENAAWSLAIAVVSFHHLQLKTCLKIIAYCAAST